MSSIPGTDTVEGRADSHCCSLAITHLHARQTDRQTDERPNKCRFLKALRISAIKDILYSMQVKVEGREKEER